MSSPQRLVLRREIDKSFTMLGNLISEEHGAVTILNLAGSQETLPRNGLWLVNEGSLMHFARLRLDLARAFAETPLAVFEQGLIDQEKGVKASDLKSRIVEAGVPSADVDLQWPKAKKHFDNSPNVGVSGSGSAMTYRWKSERTSRLRSFLPAAANIPARAELVDPVLETADSSVSPDSIGPSAMRESSDAHGPSVGETKSAQPAATETTLVVPNLLSSLDALVDKHISTRDQVLRNILYLGHALSGVVDATIQEIAVSGPDEEVAASLLNRARTKPSRHLPRGGLGVDIATAALESAIAESERVPSLGPRFARYAVRIIIDSDLSALPLALVARTFVRAAAAEASAAKPSESVLMLAGSVAERIATSVAQEWAGATSLVRDVSLGMSRLPLEVEGPRSQFLAALSGARGADLTDEALWKGIDLAALNAAADGQLQGVLRDPAIEREIIRPLIERHLSESDSRFALGHILSLRRSFALLVDQRALVKAFERAGEQDEVARRWFTDLRQHACVEQLTNERDSARADAAHAREVESSLASTVKRLENDLDSARLLIGQHRESSEVGRETETRQAKLDVRRSLALLAASVTESSSAREDAALLQRLAFALRREDLVETASAGEQVAYDPTVHDAQGQHISPGASVSVGRSGYTYDDGHERIVLVKALVNET